VSEILCGLLMTQDHMSQRLIWVIGSGSRAADLSRYGIPAMMSGNSVRQRIKAVVELRLIGSKGNLDFTR
jgi:hypothetical protein